MKFKRAAYTTLLSTVLTQERERIEKTASLTGHSISNLDADEDEKRKSHKQLKDLKIMLDEIEEEKTMPKLLDEYNAKLENLRTIIDSYADPDQKSEVESRFKSIKSDGQRAIDTKNKILLARINDQIDDLESMVLFSNLDFCTDRFEYLIDLGKDGKFTNESEARYYITKGPRRH